MNTLFILSNSPGEVSGWMGPVTRALAERDFPLDITGVTLPCPYASGMEAGSARRLPGVTEVVQLRDAMRTVPAGGKRLILQLGGDPMYGCALSLSLRTAALDTPRARPPRIWAKASGSLRRGVTKS